jgi:hypothetical protein
MKYDNLPNRVLIVDLGSVTLEQRQGIRRAERVIILGEPGAISYRLAVPIEPGLG